MKKVLLVGVFDLFHFGHLRLLKRAAKLGDYCLVGVKEDNWVLKNKPPGSMGPLYSTEERAEMIRALRCVDEVFTYRTIGEDIKKLDFDVFVKGPDQIHADVQAAVEWCRENGKEVVVLPRTEGISTTYLKRLVAALGERADTQA